MFVDTHLHVADAKFDADREAVLERASQAGVSTFVEIAESPQTWDAAVALAEKFPSIYAGLGIHPHHAHEAGPDEWPELSKKLRELAEAAESDGDRRIWPRLFPDAEYERAAGLCFRRQLELAKELNKPIVIHCRENNVGGSGSAHADVQKAIAEFYPKTSYERVSAVPPGVIHCFFRNLGRRPSVFIPWLYAWSGRTCDVSQQQRTAE